MTEAVLAVAVLLVLVVLDQHELSRS